MDNSFNLPAKVSVYYRAIGRIFAYCILHSEAIAHHVMVCLYASSKTIVMLTL
jgi:hypothetical protein